MSVQQQFGKAVAWMALGNWAEQAVNFVVFVILARLLGAESFGLLAMAGVFVILSEFLVRESFGEFLISTQNPGPAQFNTVFWALAGFGGALSLVIFWAAGPIATFYAEPEVEALIKWLCVTIPIIALTAVPVAILRREMRFRILSLRAIAGVVAGGVVGVVMALNGAGVWSLVGQRLVQVGVNVVLAWGAVAWRPSLNFDRGTWSEMGGLGGAVIALRAGEIALTQLPSLIIGATLGPVALGLFSIAWRLVDLSSVLLAMPIRQAAQPAFAALERAGERSSELLVKIAQVTGYLAIPAFIAMATLSGPLLATVFGVKWLDAVPVLAALAPIGAYFAIEKQHQAFALSKGKAAFIALVTWIEILVVSVAFVFLLPIGLEVATVAMVCIVILIWPVRFAFIAKLAGTPVVTLIYPHLSALIVAVLMALAIWASLSLQLVASMPLQLIIGTIVGITLYVLLTVIFFKERVQIARQLLAGRTEISDISEN